MRRALAGVVAIALLAPAAPAPAEPRWWWLAVGGQAAVETADRLGDLAGTEGGGLLGVGAHLLRLGPVRLGPEAEGSAGRLTADLATVTDDVTVWRARLGLRATWWPAGDAPRLRPYLRTGGVYRADRGDLIEDEGFGWYVGGGLDVRVGDRWAVGPFVTYEAVPLSVDSATWLVGLRLTFAP